MNHPTKETTPRISKVTIEPLSPELKKKSQEIIESSFGPEFNIETAEFTTIHTIPVADGAIRALHINPSTATSKRPVVFIPGWGSDPTAFKGLFNALQDSTECYWIETREKSSSSIDRRKGIFTMEEKARDIAIAMRYFGLDKKDDYVLMGTCWGSAVILNGIIEKILKAPTVVAFDPMHKIWFSDFFLRHISPKLPVWAISMLKPLLRWIALGSMKEEEQKRRAESFIDNAEIWKWKRTAESVVDYELYGRLHSIEDEIFVVNGTKDKIHDWRHYPEITRQIPKGRFIFMRTDEHHRERLMGIMAREFAAIEKAEGIPPLLQPFERSVR